MRKFTYNKNPIRKFREITDWKVAKDCNILKYNQIVDEMGDGIYSGYLNPQQLYSPNSELVKKFFDCYVKSSVTISQVSVILETVMSQISSNY